MDINMLTISKEGKVKGFGKGVIDENEPPRDFKIRGWSLGQNICMRWEFETQDGDSDDEDKNLLFGFSGQLSEDRTDFSGFFYALDDKQTYQDIDFDPFSDSDDSDNE